MKFSKLYKKNLELNNILGIYGQNASGKTTFIECFYVLKLLLSGEQMRDYLFDLLKDDKKTLFKYVFFIEEEKGKYKVSYSVELEKDKVNNKVIISKERIKYSIFGFENKTNTRTMIDYDISYDSNNVIKPIAVYNMFCKNEEDKIKLLIAKALSKENSVSFIFNQNSIDNFKDVFGSEKIYYRIINSLNYFGSHNLLVLCSDLSKNINDGLTLGLIYRLFSKSGGNIDIKVNNSKPNIVSRNAYDIMDDLIKNINVVLKAIIPDFKLGIKKKGKASIQEYEMDTEFEFISIRGDEEFPLKCEAEGTRKIVSSLGLIIAVYNNPNVCLLIDELDSGMFEFLFGEILTLLKKNSKGQFKASCNKEYSNIIKNNY